MRETLVKFSHQLKTEADGLLKKTDLIEFLAKFGHVNIGGSYALDLMVDGDIDINLVNPRATKKLSLEILQQLIIRDDFRGYVYYDFTVRHHVGFPCGYYLGLKTHYRGRKWKIDLWLLSHPYPPAERLMRLVRTKLRPQDRPVILRLKQQAKQRNIHHVSSAIYQAVLQQGITKFKDLPSAIKRAN
jgi:hypothetical protein